MADLGNLAKNLYGKALGGIKEELHNAKTEYGKIKKEFSNIGKSKKKAPTNPSGTGKSTSTKKSKGKDVKKLKKKAVKDAPTPARPAPKPARTLTGTSHRPSPVAGMTPAAYSGTVSFGTQSGPQMAKTTVARLPKIGPLGRKEN